MMHNTIFASENTVGIAQLVRALDCGSRGRRFEPDYLPRKKAKQYVSLFL